MKEVLREPPHKTWESRREKKKKEKDYQVIHSIFKSDDGQQDSGTYHLGATRSSENIFGVASSLFRCSSVDHVQPREADTNKGTRPGQFLKRT